MISVFPHDFTLRDGVLRIVSLAHPEVTKSDGFIFALDGHYILHDLSKRKCMDK